MRASGKHATVVSKRRRRYYYSPLAHMVGPRTSRTRPRISFFRGFLFLHGSVDLRFGVFRTAPMTKLPVIFCLMCFFFFPLSPVLS